jgi:two-component system sensor histidine kinase KdpD
MAALPPASDLSRFLVRRLGVLPSARAGLLAGLVAALAAVAAATLLGRIVWEIAAIPSLAMIFIPAILYAALKYGLVPALFASVLSVLAYNFFFMEPFGAFGLRGIDDALALAIFLAISAITSDLASQVRRQAAAARAREAHTAALYELKRAVDRTDTPGQLAQAVIEHLHRRFAVSAALWQREPAGGWQRLAATDPAIAIRRPEADDSRPDEEARPADAARIPMIAGGMTVGMIVTSREALAGDPSISILQALANESGDALLQVRIKEELAAIRRIADAERLRAALLNSITHDFRTPLASILGATTTLMVPGPSFTEDARTMLLGTIREEALRLDRFIRNLLDMSRLEAGAVVPNLDWVEVVDIASAAAQHVRRALRDVALDIDLPDALPLLRLDAVLMEHALVNLLDNAVKHSPPHGRIRIGTRYAGSSLILEVDDEGPGVPASERETIFEKFGKMQSGDRGRAGTGLGLSIARGFIEAQGGRLRVADNPRGGARFEVELPVPPQSSS